MSLGKLPTFGGTGRPIGIMRPTPQLGSTERTNSLNLSKQVSLRRQESKEELSPRSKMFPHLKEKLNTIKGGGSFSKFERKTPKQNVKKEGFVQEFQQSVHDHLKKKEESKQLSKAENMSKASTTPEHTKGKVKPVKEEKKEKKPKKGGRSKKGKKAAKDNSSLSGRKDVVYKTLLRSIKRYYSTLFEEKTQYNNLTKTKQDKM